MKLKLIGKIGAIVLALMVVAFIAIGVTSGSAGDKGFVGSAKEKNIANGITKIREASTKYKDLCQALPGDDARAESRWAGARNGNGDGLITGEFNERRPEVESALFWIHLERAGLLSSDFNTNAVSGLVGVEMHGKAGKGHILIICSSNLTSRLAEGVDEMLDDGVPNTGSILGFTQTVKVQADVADSAPNAKAKAYDHQNQDLLYTVCQLK